MNISILPTLRCNLCCSYCGARGLPVETHGRERKPQEWAACFAACPHDIEQVTISGGEPSLYPLAELFALTSWRFALDSNMQRHPETWCSASIDPRVVTIQGSLQFRPQHSLADVYFTHMAWLRETLPDAWLTGSYIPLWRDPDVDGDVALFTRRLTDIGIKARIGTFDATYLFPDRPPQKTGRVEWCTCGTEYAIIMPDGGAFRCLGHAHFDRQYLGNLIDDGWGVLHAEPQPCEELICSACDACTHSDILLEA